MNDDEGNECTLVMDKLNLLPERPKPIDSSISAVAYGYLSEQLGMELSDIEIVEGATVRMVEKIVSKEFQGLDEVKEKYIVEVSTNKLINRGYPFRTQVYDTDTKIEETITWSWMEENFLDDSIISDGEPALRDWLISRGVDVKDWGEDGNKSVFQLYLELISGHCRLLDSNPPFRQCAFVNTRIWNEDKTKVLIENAEKPGHGNAEVKNYYLSQKVAINESEKDFNVDNIVYDAIVEKLLNDSSSEAYRIQPFNADTLEHWGEFRISFESPSFPSLPSQYTVLTKDVIVDGLPKETYFETVEYQVDATDPQMSNIRTRHFWKWENVDISNHRIENKFIRDFQEFDLQDVNTYTTEDGTPTTMARIKSFNSYIEEEDIQSNRGTSLTLEPLRFKGTKGSLRRDSGTESEKTSTTNNNNFMSSTNQDVEFPQRSKLKKNHNDSTSNDSNNSSTTLNKDALYSTIIGDSERLPLDKIRSSDSESVLSGDTYNTVTTVHM